MNTFDCISNFIFLEDEIEEADVILIPGGSRPQLMYRAIELYKNGYAKYILPSGGRNDKLKGSVTEWDYLKSIALSEGIPEHVILKEDKAKNTFDNANFSWEVLLERNLKPNKVILVCKAHHARRALLTYKTVFPENVKFIVCPIIDERNISQCNWFEDEEKINLVMSEVVKIGEYFGKYIKNWIKF